MKINFDRIWKIIPVIGMVALLYYLIQRIGLDKIANTFTLIPPQYYLLALVPFFPRLFLHLYKWHYINKKQKMEVDFRTLLKVFLIGTFYGSITPGGLGWHIRIFYLREKCKASLEKCLANSLIETATYFIVGIFIALIGSIVIFDKLPGLLPVIFTFFLFYLAVFILLLKKSRGNKLFRFIIRPLIPKKYRGTVDNSVDSLYEDIPRFRDMFIPFFVEACIWILAAIQVYIISIPFNLQIPFVEFILISIISVVITGMVPISIGGLGVRETAFVGLTAYYLVPGEVALVISLSGFVVKLLVPALAGMILSFKEKIGKNET